ncbi:MAG: hypothetical protein ACWIPJ_05590, partial [Polaribacter sp.]
RGLLLKKIASETELIAYLKKYPIAFLVQDFLSEEYECGIFYYRYPEDTTGKITSITLKEFPFIIGDGAKTLETLIKENNRTKQYFHLLKNNFSDGLDIIIENKKKVQLSAIGNHSKGTRFLNGNYLISEKLEATITKLNIQIDGWFYGRLDVKYASFEELEKGNFKILELNGILAEPTHIYDTRSCNYLQALKEMRIHWKQLYKIARINHDQKNIPYRSTIGLLKDVHKMNKYIKNITKLNQTK